MPIHKPVTRRALLLGCLAMTALSGCGRRGPLEAVDAPAPAAKPAGGQNILNDRAAPAPKPRKPAPPNQPFFLDPLL